MSDENKEMVSMFEKHEDQINRDILPRIVHLEKAHKETTDKLDGVIKEVTDMQKGQMQLENTVLKETKNMQDLQRQGQQKVDKVFDVLIELVRVNKESDTTVSVAKLDTKTKIIVGILSAIFGAGGLLEFIRLIMKFY